MVTALLQVLTDQSAPPSNYACAYYPRAGANSNHAAELRMLGQRTYPAPGRPCTISMYRIPARPARAPLTHV